MPHIKFNWVDIVFVTLLVRIGYVGFKNGLLPEFFRLAGLLTAFILSFNNYMLVADFLAKHIKLTDTKGEVASFLLIFLSSVILFKLLAALTTKLLGCKNEVSMANKIAGGLVSLGRALLIIGFIYMLLIYSQVGYLEKSTKEKSFLATYASRIMPFTYNMFIGFYPWNIVETPLVKLLKK